MKFKANIVGTDALLKKLNRFGKEGEQSFKQITKIAAEDIKAEAKEIVSKKAFDKGKLMQSISNKQQKGISQKIYAAEKYAPYVEFGTGGLVDIPKGWEKLASKFKGKGIKKIDLPARPFMHPAFVNGSKRYLQRLERELTILTKKYNKK